MNDVDVLVIGGGPGGYVAAIRAAQLGGKVILVEKNKLGGICVNQGCIPVKFLLTSLYVYSMIRNAEHFGINTDNVSANLPTMMQRMRMVVDELVKGIDFLLERNQVRVIKGIASISTPKVVKIKTTNGEETEVKPKNIIISTGSKPAKPPIPGLDTRGVIISDEALELERVPKNILIVGGGYVGTEFAFIFNGLGTEVTVAEMMPHILPNWDDEVASLLQEHLKREGVNILTNSKVIEISDDGDVKKINLTSNGEELEIRAEKVLNAAGRVPNIDGLGLNNVGIATDGGAIVVNERMETSIPGIYAVGDVVGRFMLAYTAMSEGIVAAENAMGLESIMDYSVVPKFICTAPEGAFVGLTEKEAREQGYDIKIGRFPIIPANGRALITGVKYGLVKIVSEKRYGKILGVHIFAPQASELVHEVALAMNLEATVEDIANTIHAHPTLAETIKEAALDVDERAIHK